MKNILRYIDSLAARLRLLRRMISADLKLAMWNVRDRLSRLVPRRSPWRLATVVVIAAAVIVPSTLYVRERSRRIQLGMAYTGLSVSSAGELVTLRYTMEQLLVEQARLRGALLDAGYAVYSGNEFAVALTATGYSSHVMETDDTPFVTASNTRTRDGIVAMSRDMLRRHNPDAPFAFGDVVHITGLGDFVVEDSMNPRWRRRVDIWFPSRDEAVSFGRRQVVLHARIDEYQGGARVRPYVFPISLAAATASAP